MTARAGRHATGIFVRTGSRTAALIGGALALAAAAAAQTQPVERWRTLIAGNEQMLWLVRVDRQGGERQRPPSEVYRRTVSGPFVPQPGLNAAISMTTAAGPTLYAFCEDGAFYALVGDAWMRERDLPHRALPLELVGTIGGAYAMVPSAIAAELPALVEGQSAAEVTTFDPKAAALSLVRYDAQGWTGVAGVPPAITVKSGAKLAQFNRALFLFYVDPDGALATLRYDVARDTWSAAEKLPLNGAIGDFWPAEVNRVPAVLYARPPVDGVPELRALRHFGAATGGNWVAAELNLSELPTEVTAGQYRSALGFNQHAVLLLDTNAGGFLRFARADGPPTEATVSLTEMLARRMGPPPGARWFQYLTPLLVAVVLAALFLLRRGALRAPVTLPAAYALAFTIQRLGGLIIDLGVVGLTASLILGVNWQAGLEELFNWALGADPGALPQARTLGWWVLTAVGYAVYSFIMELALGRTLGKMAVGTRVLSDQGTPPTFLQIVLRNALRLIELLPPLWLLAFLVVLSQNRQRLGDIFARTVVVRRLRSRED